MTLGEFRKATEGLSDDMPILYAWTWRPPTDLCLGGYMSNRPEALLLDGNQGAWAKQFSNQVLWEQTEPSPTVRLGDLFPDDKTI